MAHASLGSMVVRAPGYINTQALAADETIVLDLTSRQDLRALPDTIGLVTSLQSLCLAGALASLVLQPVLMSCRIVKTAHLLLRVLHRVREHHRAAGLGRTAVQLARA